MTITSLSGRAVPLILDHADYGSAVLLQGAPIPWTDLPALVGYLRQVQALLDPDALYLDAGALLFAGAARVPGLIGEMAARSRTGYALRTLLASPELLDFASVTIRTAGDAVRREVTLAVPSPARFLMRAHAIAGTDVANVSADQADSASMYLAEWLGKLGSMPLSLVLLDARHTEGDTAELEAAERLADYSAITNVARHLALDLALRTDEGLEVDGDASAAVIPDSFWLAEDPGAPAPAELWLTHVPAQAHPETVLERITLLNSDGS
ncbi:MAG: hypothetical protein IPI13_17370 [Actinomycetales bacterium]|uniref:Uncharacterized protein n=1 Tax=Candidatus Phosphoribacter hodrii TaxID=2953743 RepID=A0A935IMG6_9MICO|nr:hypothetical protein [Candidatus Phosphoribacter hodrii]